MSLYKIEHVKNYLIKHVRLFEQQKLQEKNPFDKDTSSYFEHRCHMALGMEFAGESVPVRRIDQQTSLKKWNNCRISIIGFFLFGKN